MFRLKGTHIVEHGPGSSFWVKGDFVQPVIGNIYTQETDATLFTSNEVLMIIQNFSEKYEIHVINA